MHTVWSSELDTLLMRYEVNLTPYRIKSVSNSLDQAVHTNRGSTVYAFEFQILRNGIGHAILNHL